VPSVNSEASCAGGGQLRGWLASSRPSTTDLPPPQLPSGAPEGQRCGGKIDMMLAATAGSASRAVATSPCEPRPATRPWRVTRRLSIAWPRLFERQKRAREATFAQPIGGRVPLDLRASAASPERVLGRRRPPLLAAHCRSRTVFDWDVCVRSAGRCLASNPRRATSSGALCGGL